MASLPGPRRPNEVARYTARFATQPHMTMMRLYEEYGEAVAFGFGPTRAVGLFGPEANRFVVTHDENFRWREAFEFLVPLNGETALVVSDGDEHRRRRRLAAPAFSRRSVDSYVPIMVATADRVIDSWRPGQVVDLYAAFRSVVLRATVQVLFGTHLADDADELGARMQPMLDFVDNDAFTQNVHRRLRTPRWRAAAAARVDVDERIAAEIGRRRSGEHPGDATDMLTRLTAAADGEALRDEEIRDQVVSLVAAGFETTSAGLAWTFLAMLSDREVWRRAKAEVLDVCRDHPPTADDLDRLPFLAATIAESLRLYPPAAVSARWVHEGSGSSGTRSPRRRCCCSARW